MWKGRSRTKEQYDNERDSPDSGVSDEPSTQRSPPAHKPKLTFHCQQAQGSPTGIISGFTNVKELYQKIAEVYEITAEEILFCTLNTYKIDMSHLLGGQIGLDDFIFAHRKGQPKEVEITKTQDALGLTITDNGAGYAFIKRIKDGSIISKISYISVGDHIEKIDDESLVGCRHYEVARKLKEIPKGKTFVLRLVEPLKAGFCNVGPKNSYGSNKKGYGTGKQTLRFKSNGSAQVEEIDDSRTLAENKINEVLEVFMGINDLELASQIWELAVCSRNTMDFAEAIDNSSLEPFGFTDDFIIELWGIVTDAKSGRLKKAKH
ncbi:PDZ domain-containing protein GIPC3 [Lepeophtheirus salmonis]|uniref:PDZ domain-containing protein GIPC3 n=1 Tax=Lepeophtheirus salmonis TaxID=72036 RepID=UPI001AE760CE|nr:PDZ domain-containing protein GIPC3-like [Lepeophtheirus salmonis]